MTIDNEKAVVLTEEQFKDLTFKVTDEMTAEFADKNPKMALVTIAMGAMFAAKLTEKLFGEEAAETEEAKPELKFGDE